jgi:hypothetical protein
VKGILRILQNRTVIRSVRNLFKMNRVISFLFFVGVVLLTACSASRSFKLVNTKKQQHEFQVASSLGSKQMNPEISQTTVYSEEQKFVDQMSSPSNVQVVKRLVIEKKKEAVQSIKTAPIKLKQFIVHKKIQPSDNFWSDLIKDFFLFMLVGLIIVGIIAAMIVYGNPTVQLIGKIIAIIIISIATLALLFS